MLPVTLVDGTGVTVVVSSVARIVPVDGDVAEIVFALGLGDQVVATDLSAMYPPEAAARPRIGYQRALNAEPIAAVAPTLVLATDLARPVEALAQIRSLGIPLVVVRRTMDLGGPAAKIRAVAAALGVPGRGEVLARRVEGELEQAAAVARRAVTHPKVLVLYVRGEQVQLILGHGSGIDAVLAAAGATDVASELGFADSQPITAEAMLRAAPDVLVVTTTGLASVGGLDGLLSIHAIARTPAGQQRRVLAFEDQYLLGAGPRTGQLLGELTRALHPSSN